MFCVGYYQQPNQRFIAHLFSFERYFHYRYLWLNSLLLKDWANRLFFAQKQKLGNRQNRSTRIFWVIADKNSQRIHFSSRTGVCFHKRHDHTVQFMTSQYYLCSCFGQCCKPIKTNRGASRWGQDTSFFRKEKDMAERANKDINSFFNPAVNHRPAGQYDRTTSQ